MPCVDFLPPPVFPSFRAALKQLFLEETVTIKPSLPILFFSHYFFFQEIFLGDSWAVRCRTAREDVIVEALEHRQSPQTSSIFYISDVMILMVVAVLTPSLVLELPSSKLNTILFGFVGFTPCAIWRKNYHGLKGTFVKLFKICVSASNPFWTIFVQERATLLRWWNAPDTHVQKLESPRLYYSQSLYLGQSPVSLNKNIIW